MYGVQKILNIRDYLIMMIVCINACRYVLFIYIFIHANYKKKMYHVRECECVFMRVYMGPGGGGGGGGVASP